MATTADSHLHLAILETPPDYLLHDTPLDVSRTSTPVPITMGKPRPKLAEDKIFDPDDVMTFFSLPLAFDTMYSSHIDTPIYTPPPAHHGFPVP